MPYEDEDAIYDGYEEDDDAPGLPHGLRFGEGQPINRGGRPRGSQNIATMVRRVAFKRHRVRIDGVVRRKNTVELVLLALRKKAAEGNVKAFKLQQSAMQSFAPREHACRAVLIGPEKLNEDEWIAVYGFEYSDDEVAEKFPYLMRARKAYQEYREKTELALNEAKGRTQSVAGTIRADPTPS